MKILVLALVIQGFHWIEHLARTVMTQGHKAVKVIQYLGRNRLMTLGTSFNNKPWAATVFFAFDKKLHLLFYSRKDTRHCRHIGINPHVSIVINHDWKDKSGFIRGLQITGRATKVLPKDYSRYYYIYKSRFRWADDFVSDHLLYIIKPKEVWYIDQKLFGHFYRVRVI